MSGRGLVSDADIAMKAIQERDALLEELERPYRLLGDIIDEIDDLEVKSHVMEVRRSLAAILSKRVKP